MIGRKRLEISQLNKQNRLALDVRPGLADFDL